MAAIAGRRYTIRSVSPAGNRCHFVLLDKDESNVVQQLTCLTISRSFGPAYSTGELLNTTLVT